VAQVLAASAPQVIEAGAGSGRLAVDLLRGARRPRLRARALPASSNSPANCGRASRRRWPNARRGYADRVEWLDALPERFSGCLVGNEVLDAMPTHALRWDDGSDVLEGGVG
jgi:SAM-dependent MidA family methyltransferase